MNLKVSLKWHQVSPSGTFFLIIFFRRFRCLCVRFLSGLLLLDSALFHVDGTLCPECVRTFRNPNECCFLRYAASVCCVAQTAPTGPRRSHLWSSHVKTGRVRVCVWIFLWENHHVVNLGLLSRVPHPPLHLSGEMPFSQTVYNSAKFGPRLSPVRWSGVELESWVRVECVGILERANFSERTLSRPKVWTHKCDICCTVVAFIRIILKKNVFIIKSVFVFFW